MSRGRVTGDDDRLHALLEQERADLAAVASYRLGRLGSIRHARRIAEVHEALQWKLTHDRMRHSQAAEARVEDADGRRVPRRRRRCLGNGGRERRGAHHRSFAATTVPAGRLSIEIWVGRSHR